MKNFKQTFLGISLLTIGIFISSTMLGQISNFDPPTDTLAVIGELYTHDFYATGNPDNPSYSLDKALDGMTINSTTGVLTWTPGSEADGGKVVVRATNTGFTETVEFNIYVAGEIQCDPSTVAYWKLDELGAPGTATLKDSYGTHDATEVGTVDDSAGVVDRAAGFRYISGNGISVPDHSDFHTANGESFSVSMWFKIWSKVFPLPPVMMGRNEGAWPAKQWWIGFQDWPAYDVWFYVKTGLTINDYEHTNIKGWALDTTGNVWYHLVCMYDANDDEMRMYLNGSNTDDFSGDNRTQSFVATDHFDATTTMPVSIGCMNSGYPFRGNMDEVLFFNKALNQSEVTDLYTKGNGGNPACDLGNYGPIFITDPVTEAREDQAYTYQFKANDIDAGDVLTYAVDKNPAWLNVNLGTRTLSGTPTNDDVGSDSVVIKVNDGTVDVYQRFLLTVINSNDAPVITSTEVTTVDEEQPYSYDVDASDDDVGDNLTFSLRPPTPGWLSVNASTGLITGTPPVNNDGDATVTVRVTDDSAAYDEQTYILDILPVNDAPIITGQSPLEVDEDNSLLIELIDVTYTDVDNGPADMTLTILAGTNYTNVGNTITPVLNYSGALVVNIELSDLDSTTSGQLNVTVNPINDPPEITSLPEDTAFEGQSYSYVFNATDPDLDGLTYSIPKKPTWLTWVEGIRTLSGTPTFVDIGSDSLTIRVTDGTTPVEATVVIDVLSANNIPYITSTPETEVNEDEMYIYNITFEDEDPGDVLTLTCPVRPGWLTFNQDQQLLSGTPTNDQVGTEPSADYTVQRRIYDGKQDSTQTVTITVTNINEAPEILGPTGPVTANIGVVKTILLSNVDVVDVDNNIEDLTLTVLPGTGYSIAGNDITLDQTQEVIVPVNIRITDPGDLSDEGIINVTVLDNTGIEDMNRSNRLVENIYPIPASEHLKFVINSTEDFNIELIDITGKSVFKQEFSANDKLLEISTDNLPGGLYIFKVYNKSVYQIGRITISGK